MKVMIPNKPDHPFVYWATMSYVGDLLNAGAEVYIYQNGFLHAKTIIVDGKLPPLAQPILMYAVSGSILK